MQTNTSLMIAALAALAIVPSSAVAVEGESTQGDGNCNDTNYGVQFNTYIFASRDCSWYEDNDATYVQNCDSTTKVGYAAGSGAGHGGQPKNTARMEMTAGTQCTNGNTTA